VGCLYYYFLDFEIYSEKIKRLDGLDGFCGNTRASSDGQNCFSLFLSKEVIVSTCGMDSTVNHGKEKGYTTKDYSTNVYTTEKC